MKDDLDKMTWAEYQEKYGVKNNVTKPKTGYTKEKLIQIIQLADLHGIKMFMWSSCLRNYVRVYRNSMLDCVTKAGEVDKIAVKKEFRELFFR